MIPACALVIILRFLPTPIAIEKQAPPKVLTLFSYTATLSIFIDTALTYDNVWNREWREDNPFWRPLLKNPPLVIMLDMATVAGITLLVDHLWRKDKKTLAWGLLAAVHIIQGYYIYKNLKDR